MGLLLRWQTENGGLFTPSVHPPPHAPCTQYNAIVTTRLKVVFGWARAPNSLTPFQREGPKPLLTIAGHH